MFKNNIKIAWRNISRHKFYSVINIFGLALGVCSCTVIYLITSYELNFDKFHPDKERIYRIMLDAEFNSGAKFHMNRLPFSAVINARNDIAGMESIAAISMFDAKVTVPETGKPVKTFDSRVEGVSYPGTVVAEPQYFDIFKYNWLAGDAKTALNQPYSVVLVQSKAQKYFGPVAFDKMIGSEIIYDDSVQVRVSGIVEDWKKNTDLAFTDFISYSTAQNGYLKKTIGDDWRHFSTSAFAKLSKGATPEQVNTQMAALINKYAPNDPTFKLTFWLEPLNHIHFNSDVIENPIRTADLPAMYSLIGIAIFILLLAVINFINLSTAQSIQRIKEIGVRKILGNSRAGIAFQFLTETFLVTFIAVLIAIILVNPVLSAFQSFIPKGVIFNPLNPSTAIFLLLVIIITCMLSGLYPARVLSSYSPVLSLKGAVTQKGSEKWWLRKSLIVFQFAVSLVFIISSLVINKQLQYTRDKDMGFNADAIVIVPANRKDTAGHVKLLEEKIKQLVSISAVARQDISPMDGGSRAIVVKHKSAHETETSVEVLAGDEEFIPLYQMKLLAGRNLMPADSLTEYVINETCSRMLGFNNPGQAIGNMLYFKDRPYPIVGVVADFNEKSFRETILPVCIVNIPTKQGSLAVKLAVKGKQADAVKTTLSGMEKIWKEIYPGEPFNYSFFDESIARFYEKDYKTAKLMNTAMGITIFISCIGLFGLAMFTAGKRTKEIGIRKVLGASVTNITMMLSKDFVILVIIALVIASPVAWYFMDRWLQDFVYRINIRWWVFILAGMAAIFIALITVSFQAIKAAMTDPVKSLRTE